jgi:hypothetical protein
MVGNGMGNDAEPAFYMAFFFAGLMGVRSGWAWTLWFRSWGSLHMGVVVEDASICLAILLPTHFSAHLHFSPGFGRESPGLTLQRQAVSELRGGVVASVWNGGGDSRALVWGWGSEWLTDDL